MTETHPDWVKPLNAYTDEDHAAAEAARINALLPQPSNREVLAAVETLTARVNEITDAVTQIVGIAEQVKDQATPTLDAITSSPMFKMIAGKVKK